MAQIFAAYRATALILTLLTQRSRGLERRHAFFVVAAVVRG